MKSTLLALKNIDVFYGHIHAVRRVTLHVRQGEIVALIGGNGAGKTTMLCTISGLIRPSQGSILYQDVEITRQSPEAIVRAGLSHVPEGRLVFSPLSVEDNLHLGAYTRPYFRKRSDMLQDVETMYTMFPVLRERRHQYAGTLSGGEQQMLAIARALMARPKLLLLDEPGMGLAPLVVKDIFRHILNLRDELGLTVLLVEQNARSALKVADRGYVLENGRILIQGTAGELLANHDVQRAYLGRELDEN
ncbi:MAG: ABC transporter ATP-binding protein [Desulfomicrobium sp.]|nr:ABC transporter ATP-binding protein [Desulfomicrobium sp.]